MKIDLKSIKIDKDPPSSDVDVGVNKAVIKPLKS